jgi:hypothetical protein
LMPGFSASLAAAAVAPTTPPITVAAKPTAVLIAEVTSWETLRAEFAEQTAIALGYTPPTLGGIRGELQKEEEQFVRRQVAQAMGHSRVSVTSVYYGSHRSVGKQDRNPLI